MLLRAKLLSSSNYAYQATFLAVQPQPQAQPEPPNPNPHVDFVTLLVFILFLLHD